MSKGKADFDKQAAECSLSAIAAKVAATSECICQIQHLVASSKEELRNIQWELEDLYISLGVDGRQE